jgi:methionine-S-sulfoxide reductase
MQWKSLFLTLIISLCSTHLFAQEFSYQFNQSISAQTKMTENQHYALLAGGCFWCIEAAFDGVDGVQMAISGYTGGVESHPSYKQVASGYTGHKEAVWIVYDPTVISYGKILEIFWKNIDPTQADGQFADIGAHYQTAIFALNQSQYDEAIASREALSKKKMFRKPIVTEIIMGQTFWPAEESHQNYHLENKAHYQSYKEGSGRAGFIRKVWGKH